MTTPACQVDHANAIEAVVVAWGNTNEWPTKSTQEIISGGFFLSFMEGFSYKLAIEPNVG